MQKRVFSRREFLVLSGGTIALSTLSPLGCTVLPTVAIRVAPKVFRVFWGAIRIADAIMTVKAVYDGAENYLTPKVSATDIASIQRNAPVVLIDGNDKQFNLPYVVCEYVGIVQTCYRGESLTLHNNPQKGAGVIRALQVGETLGVIDLRHVKGWYHVQTLSGNKGWIHGNCLERLPRKY